MGRELSPRRRVEILFLAGAVLAFTYLLLDLLDLTPAVYLEATLLGKALILVGLYVFFALLFTRIYRMLPASRV